jgi:hypothetical protein
LFAAWSHLVIVGTLVLAAFLDEAVVDQRVEIRVESTVVDIVNVRLEFLSDCLAGGLI